MAENERAAFLRKGRHRPRGGVFEWGHRFASYFRRAKSVYFLRGRRIDGLDYLEIRLPFA
ncbi:MAG: hypothetical protein C0607_14925 [Azoarcus sp.]|nr:MAG: hypothetical protein C0607_14925 [Azoarcus sp.]